MNHYIIEWTEKTKLFAIVKADNQALAVKKWATKTKQQTYNAIEKFDGTPPFIYFMLASCFIQ